MSQISYPDLSLESDPQYKAGADNLAALHKRLADLNAEHDAAIIEIKRRKDAGVRVHPLVVDVTASNPKRPDASELPAIDLRAIANEINKTEHAIRLQKDNLDTNRARTAKRVVFPSTVPALYLAAMDEVEKTANAFGAAVDALNNLQAFYVARQLDLPDCGMSPVGAPSNLGLQFENSIVNYLLRRIADVRADMATKNFPSLAKPAETPAPAKQPGRLARLVGAGK